MDQDIEQVAKSVEALYGSGALSDRATDALQGVVGVADILAAGLGGATVRDDLVLVTILCDDSTSIESRLSEIRSGHSLMLEALRAESFEADVRVHTRALNRGVISPYKSLANAMPLTEQNYNGTHLTSQTPLYLQSLLALGTVLVKAQAEEERGVKVRTFNLIITDGADNKSGAINARHVRALVTDMVEFSTNHIVAAMGIGDPGYFRAVFRDLGIPNNWIFSPGTSVDELRRMFRQIAQLLALAASSEAAFAQLLLGPPSDPS